MAAPLVLGPPIPATGRNDFDNITKVVDTDRKTIKTFVYKIIVTVQGSIMGEKKKLKRNETLPDKTKSV